VVAGLFMEVGNGVRGGVVKRGVPVGEQSAEDSNVVVGGIVGVCFYKKIGACGGVRKVAREGGTAR